MAPTNRASSRKPRQTKTNNSKVVKVGGRTEKQRDERPARDARLLDAVNGIISPSTVGPQGPDQGSWDSADPKLVHRCSICGRRFYRREHVKVHMAPCVQRNGNPNGAHWDDAWKNSNQDENEDTEAATDSQEREPEYQSEERDPPDLSPSTPHGDHSIPGNSPIGLHSSPSSPVPSSSPSLRRNATPLLHDPQSHEDTDLGIRGPYDPTLAMDHLSNETLVGMVYHLDYVNYHQHMGQDHMGPHPQLENIMKELEVRGIAREQRSWTLELEGGAMEFTMVGRGRPGS